MITTSDAANIIAVKCRDLGIADIRQGGNIDEGEITSERVVIIPKAESDGRLWKSIPVEVNILVPNIAHNTLNLVRLGELERAAKGVFRDCITGIYDETPYRYAPSEIGRVQSENLRIGWINIHIFFETLKTKSS